MILSLVHPNPAQLGVLVTLLVATTLVAGAMPAAAAGGDAPERAARVDVRGLPHRSVLALLEDRDGFLWIGTADGLARFDGYEMVVFQHDPLQPEGLANSTVTALVEDRRGLLWIGTEDGIHAFDRSRGAIERLDRTNTHGVSVSCALEDGAGRLWFGTLASGLLTVDPTTGTVRRLRVGADAPDSIRHANVRALHEDADGNLWVLSCTADTCCVQRRVDDSHFQVIVNDLRPSQFWALHRDRSGAVWVGPCRPFEPAEATSEVTTTLDCAGSGTWAIAADGGDRIWFGTADGLFRIDGPTRMTTRVELGGGRDYLGTFVRALHLGRSGILWVGTHSGLFAVDPHAKRFHHWDLRNQPSDGDQVVTAVSSLVESPEGDLFVGTYGGGLLRLDRSGRRVERYRTRPGDDTTLPSDVVWALAADQEHRLWIAAGGLAHLDLRSDEMESVRIPEESNPTFVAADPGGPLWLAGFRGLARFEPDTGAYAQVSLTPDGSEVAVQSLYRGDHALWIGTSESLFRLDLTSSTVSEIPLETADGISLHGSGTWTIHPGEDGSLWLGTSVGLVRYSGASDEVELVSRRQGLPGSSVYSILEDDAGRLWLGTNRGLSRFDPGQRGDGRFRNFSADEGLGNVEFNRHAAHRARDGTLFYGGLDGVTWFQPDEIRPNPTVPPVRLTRIEVLGDEGTRSLNPYRLERLVLSPGDVSVTFEFAGLSYTNPQQNRYAYRLEGLDPRWIDAGSRRFAQYTRIPPGRYVFHVQGANNDGVWNREGLSLPIRIRPAWWQTWWFRLGVVALVAGAVAAAYRYRMAQVRKLQQLRLDVAGDLHDDLSSDLAGIAVVADILGRQPNLARRQHADLEMIRDTARRLVEGVRDIVWYMDPEHDSLEATADRMRAVAERLLRGTPHNISVRVPKRAPELSMEVRRDVFLIYKEALQNVVKHADAGRVDVELSVDGRRLRLVVADDGAGFDPGDAAAGHGLRSMRRRAEHIDAELRIDSRPGAGTRVILELDLARFRDGTLRPRDVG